MTRIRQMGFFALALPSQARFRICRTLVLFVRSLLAMEIDTRIARIVGRLVRRWLALGSKALEAGGGLDERSVHREVLVAQQVPLVGTAHHCIKELLGHAVRQKPLSVLGASGRGE